MSAVGIPSSDDEQPVLQFCLKYVLVPEPKCLTLGLRQAYILWVGVITLNLNTDDMW